MSPLTITLIDQSIPLLLGVFFTLYAHGIIKLQPRKTATEAQAATVKKLLKVGGPFLILISLLQLALALRT